MPSLLLYFLQGSSSLRSSLLGRLVADGLWGHWSVWCSSDWKFQHQLGVADDGPPVKGWRPPFPIAWLANMLPPLQRLDRTVSMMAMETSWPWMLPNGCKPLGHLPLKGHYQFLLLHRLQNTETMSQIWN